MTIVIVTWYFTDLYWKRVSPCLVSTKLDKLYARKVVCWTKTLREGGGGHHSERRFKKSALARHPTENFP